MDLNHSNPRGWCYWGADFLGEVTDVREVESFANTWSREGMVLLGLRFPCSRKPAVNPDAGTSPASAAGRKLARQGE